ncbi:hypothetical protein Salat_2506200 [Sesamum alatum]|uniref:Uncharacterized protein n=1 Tax=Sesamum alatum TaxID=300844 RepID=A0AAE2CC87_9LAMI|nr:hypothetical protein Salat_2506200 [Sesamum alatum]
MAAEEDIDVPALKSLLNQTQTNWKQEMERASRKWMPCNRSLQRTAIEKQKVTVGQEEIKKKAVQIENMSIKLEEMEQFAMGTNSILNEMRQRVEDLVEETSRQRQRAAENEQELCRVKQDFESLKSYVSTLISVRETLLSSEKQFQTIEKHFERLVAKTSQLENEKMQKEAEVQKLMEENVRLSGLLDKKEAQLVAMNEQCKVMALNASNI